MSIIKAFTFQAGTKARANEVNKNFDDLYSQVNINIADIAQNARDIDTLGATKANINGSSARTFAVADPVNPTDAVNKQTLKQNINNSIDIISGFTIEKDSASPNNTIIVSDGSAYDSTKSIVLSRNISTTKTNENQAANATYYVYVVGDSSGIQTDILISDNTVTPDFPVGYVFRKIGYYKTDSSNKISTISNFGIKIDKDNSGISNVVESFTNRTEGYRIYSDGYCEQWGFSLVGTAGPRTISLIKKYKDINYNVQITQTMTTATNYQGNELIIRPLEVNSFIIWSGGPQYDNAEFWKTCGYLAKGEY